MRRAAVICLSLAVLLTGFAWWGLLTPSGQRSFGETDGVVPVAAGVLGALLAIAGIITWGMSRRG